MGEMIPECDERPAMRSRVMVTMFLAVGVFVVMVLPFSVFRVSLVSVFMIVFLAVGVLVIMVFFGRLRRRTLFRGTSASIKPEREGDEERK